MTLLTQTIAPDAGAIAPVLREVVHKLDPDMPMFLARTMHDLYTQMGIGTSSLIMGLTAGMGVLGMVLATVGLYGLVAYSVSRRTRELGIRMALGADRGAVVRMVLWQGLQLGIAGIAVGLPLARYASRLVAAILPCDHTAPLVYVAIPLPLLLITLLAAWGPARRAAQVDPLIALRDE
jgi:ABC-type antimicrobial peptide transport system permease subunit